MCHVRQEQKMKNSTITIMLGPAEFAGINEWIKHFTFALNFGTQGFIHITLDPYVHLLDEV